MNLWRKLLALLPSRRAALERDMQEELESLKAMASRNELGNLTRVAEDARAVWHWNWLETLWQDIRHSVRTLRKSPGFVISAVLILSFGIGLNLAFFQFINVIFLKPLAVRDADSLVHVTVPAGEDELDYSAMQFLWSNSNVFSAVLLDMRVDAPSIANGGRAAPERTIAWDGTISIRAHFVSPNWFDDLGVKPLRGRLFSESTDGGPDAAPVAVVSERFWETHLQKDPDIVGSAVSFTEGGGPVTIIGIVPSTPGGVLPAGDSFAQLNAPAIWAPVVQIPYLFPGTHLSTFPVVSGRLLGRLKPGISLRAASEGLRPVLDELARQQPRYGGNNTVALYSGATNFRHPNTTLRIWALVGGIGSFSGLILLIACSNLANLVLSRTINRIQELSVRVSLGASRSRILRHILTETALVAVAASGGGLLIAHLAARGAVATYPEFSVLDLSLDWRTMVVAFAGTIFMTAFVGLIPAWTIAKRDLAIAMKDGGEQASSSLSRVRQRQFLLAVQVAGSCLLLVLTGCMLRTLQRAFTPPGFDAENVLVLDLGRGNTAEIAYWKNLREYMAQQPGIESVALSEARPPRNIHVMRVAALPGLSFDVARAEPDFFEVLRIPFLTGKPFASSDADGQSIVISRDLAMRMFGTVDVVGRPFPEYAGRVAGVVGDVRLRPPELPDRSEVYVPLKVYIPSREPDRLALLVRARTRADAARLLLTLPKSLRQFDSRIPNIYTLSTGVTTEQKLVGASLSALSAFALSVASMGIFGVVSYSVALRRKEIGIRLALGALHRSILWLMARQLIWPVSLAVVVGVIGGSGLAMTIASDGDLFPVEATVVAAAVMVLLASVGLACLLPTLRMLRSSAAKILYS